MLLNWKRVVVVGLVASVAMGMVEMMLEAALGEEGFWAPLLYIGATALRDYQTVASSPDFAFAPVMLGLMGHMMNSVVFAIPFAALAPRVTRSRLVLVLLGMMYGLILFGIMWTLVLPIVDPVMLRLNGGVFAFAHAMLGAVMGILVERRSASAVAAQASRRFAPRPG